MSEERKSMLPFYMRILIALGYIAIGLIMFNTNVGEMMTGSKNFGWFFGSLCLAYGLFRIYRARKVLNE